MEPGRQMEVSVELLEQDGVLATFKGKGEVDGATTVSSRLTLARSNLRDRNPALRAVDERIVAYLRQQGSLLRGELTAH
jgi:hypothetical protein